MSYEVLTTGDILSLATTAQLAALTAEDIGALPGKVTTIYDLVAPYNQPILNKWETYAEYSAVTPKADGMYLVWETNSLYIWSGGVETTVTDSDTIARAYTQVTPYILGANDEDILDAYAVLDSIYILLPDVLAKPTRVNRIIELVCIGASTNGTTVNAIDKWYTYEDTDWTIANADYYGTTGSVRLPSEGAFVVFNATVASGTTNEYNTGTTSTNVVAASRLSGFVNAPDLTNPAEPKRYSLTALEYARLGYTDAWFTGTETPWTHTFTDIPETNDFYLQSNADVYQFTGTDAAVEVDWTLMGNMSTVTPLPLASATDNHVPSGFINHLTSTLTLTENVGAVNDTFSVTLTGTDFPVYINGTKYLKNTESITQVGALSKRYFIFYLAATQALTIADESWNLESGEYDGSAPIATVLWDATNHQGILEEERHHSWRDVNWHHWAHHTTGALYSTAHFADAFTLTYAGTAPNLTFSMSRGSIYDEDIANHTAGALTTCNLFYHAADGSMVWEKNVNKLYKLTGTVPQYDTGTGLAAKNASNTSGYFVSWVYGTNGSNDGTLTKRDLAVVVGQDNNNTMTLTEAQNAAFPTLPIGFIVEWKLLYKVIFLYNGASVISRVSTTDYRISGALPSGQAPTSNVSASSVSYAPTGSLTSTNVQGAIDELAASSGGGVTVYFPFYKAAGTIDNISLVSQTSLPFKDASGTDKNILLVT
jgi:hypothetical protein